MRDPNKLIQTVVFNINQTSSLLLQTLTVSDLARQIRQSAALISIEKNGEPLAESCYQATLLRPGDRYEFVVALDANA